MFDLILIDFSWLYNRYYFIAKTKTSGAVEKDALLLELTRMLSQFLRLIEKSYSTSKITLVLDSPTSSLKNKALYEGYKQNRDKETKKEVYAILENVIYSLNTELSKSFIFAKAATYEADQVIAALCERYHEDHQILIYSGDKDLLQLTALSNVYSSDNYEKGAFILKTDNEIFSKFKNSKGEDFTRISMNKADILKYRSLKGDPSDNLPPVFPRIKDKEIVSVIKDYWIPLNEDELTSDIIDNMLSKIQVNNPVLANKLSDSKEDWLRNYKIMNLRGYKDICIKKVRK